MLGIRANPPGPALFQARIHWPLRSERRTVNCHLMKNYRAYAVWPNGNFEGYEALICVDDDDAIGRARRLADKSAIELWSGERFITRLEHKSK
jgi:hypothetical protein